ncbi:MAG: gliding motility-associated C-terminal domain-containing protein [Bacteroidota bacterium]
MKPIYLVCALCVMAFRLTAHQGADQHKKYVLTLSNDSVNDVKFRTTVPCATTGSDLALSNVVGEQPMTGDNDPANGAFMRWTASGGSGFYFSQLYHADGGPVYDVTDPATGFSVFTPNNGTDFDEEVAVTVEFSGECLPPGNWTVRVWAARDLDNDRQPDRDIDGNLIGCFVEENFTFFPSCAQLGTNVPFTVDPRDLGCNGTGGSIGLLDFQEEFMYCVEESGAGATFEWTGPNNFRSSNRDVADLIPGIYTVEVKDFYGCTFRWSREIVDLDNLAFVCELTDSLSEFGASDGVIVVEASAGSGDYDLSWTGPIAGSRPGIGIGPQTLTGLPAGTYDFTIVDNVSTCVETCSIEIPVPPCLIDFDVVYDENTGTVRVRPLGGTADFFLSYFGPTEREDIGPFGFEGITFPQSDFLLGNYAFVLREANRPDCALSQAFFIPPECFISATANPVDPTCTNDSDGSIAVSVINNLGPVTYDWSDDAFDGRDSVGDLPAGTYTIRISDSAECFFAPLVVVLADPPPVRVVIRQVETACFGEGSNALLAEVTDGFGELSYAWSVPAPDTNRIGGLSTGTYSVTVTDANGCVGDTSFTIIDPPELTLDCFATDETVVGREDGSIRVAAAGAMEGVRLTGDLGDVLLNPSSDTTFTGLAPGTYELLLTNPNGCTAACTATIERGVCVLEVDITPTQPDCDSATGSATAEPRNDLGPLTYEWSNLDVNQTATNLVPGTYTVTVRDTFDCVATAEVTILEFTDFPTLANGPATVACPEGGCSEVEFTLTGTPPFRIQFETDQAGSPTVRSSFTLNESGIHLFCPEDFGYTTLSGASIFLRDVTDGNGCDRPINRLIPLSVFAEARGQLDTVLCLGANLDYFGTRFNAANPTGEVRLPLPTANGCDSTVAVSVSFFAPARSTLDTTICREDTLVYFGELFHAQRTSAAVVLSGVTPNGCDSVVVVNLSFFPAAVGTVDTTLCIGDTLRVMDEVFHEGRPFGRITLPRVTANGCDSTVDVSLDFFPPARGNFNPTLCFGDTLRYGGERFHATNRAGEVVFPGASANGCDSTVSVFVDILQPGRSTFDTTICRNDVLVFHGEEFNVRRLTGDVVVPTPSANGCDSIVTVNLAFFPQNFDVFDTTICAGDSFIFLGVVFSEEVDRFFIPLGGASVNGCDSIVAVRVQIQEPTTVALSGEGIVCPDGSLEVVLAYTGADTADVRLSDRPTEPILVYSDTTVLLRDVVVGSTLSIISVDDGTPCPPVFSGSVTVGNSDLAVGISITSGNGIYAVSCADGSDGAVTAIPTGGDAPYTFEWNTGDTEPSLQGLPVGEYSIKVTSNRGCVARASIDLTSPEVLAVQLTELPAGCRDTLPALVVNAIRGGVEPYLYQVTGDPGFRPAGPFPDTLWTNFGEATFALEDVNGCSLEQAFTFNRPGEGQIAVTPSRSLIGLGDSVALTVTTDLNAEFYHVWPRPDSIVFTDRFFVSPTQTTTYVITAVDPDGCEATTTAEVLVDQYVPVYVPNVFSPNGDGNNDKFRAYGDQSIATFSEFRIYERWGGLVFELEEPVSPEELDWGWDGRKQGGRLYEQHVYGYSVKVTFTNGREIFLKGDVLLMR